MKISSYIKFLTVCIPVLIFAGCLTDKGNYRYTEVPEVAVTIKDTLVEQFTVLKMEPEMILPTGYGYDDFDYEWLAYPKNTGTIARTDTLSRNRILNDAVNIKLGTYQFQFRATHKQTGIFYTSVAQLEVQNSYTSGTLVLSDVNGDANLAFINTLDQVLRNAFQAVNGKVAGKNPVGVKHMAKGPFMEAEPVIFIFCDDEEGGGGSVIDPAGFEEWLRVEDLFTMRPSSFRPQLYDMYWVTYCDLIINNGKLHTREVDGNDMFPKFDIPKGGNHEIAPAAWLYNSGGVFYDQLAKRFLFARDLYTSSLVAVLADPDNINFNPANVGLTCLTGQYVGSSGYALMEDGDKKKYILTFYFSTTSVSPTGKFHLELDGVEDAISYAIPNTRDFVYLAFGGNKIACFSVQTGNLMFVYDDFPAGQQIDCIKCRIPLNAASASTMMWVGLSDGSGDPESGSVYIFDHDTDGSLILRNKYENICGKVVDFHYAV